jgi:hypothetical protein
MTIKPPSPVYERQEIEFSIAGFESAPERCVQSENLRI